MDDACQYGIRGRLDVAASEWDDTSVYLAIAATVGGFAVLCFASCIGYIADRFTDIQVLSVDRK